MPLSARLASELNGPQLEAVTTSEGPILILAGAGSGKTRVITFRIAHLLELGIPQSQILALTFTNKAAREMAERVAEVAGGSPRRLTVCTFHAYGARFLREHIKLLGYRKQFSIYDGEDRRSLIRDVASGIGLDARNLDLQRIEGVISDIKTGRKTLARRRRRGPARALRRVQRPPQVLQRGGFRRPDRPPARDPQAA